MIKIQVSLLTAAILLACSVSSIAQTADEIVQKHIAAIGGIDNWKKINSIKVIGTVRGEGGAFPLTITTINKKAQRVEFTIEGKTGYEILTTTGGWSYHPMQEGPDAEAVPAEIVKESQDELDVEGPLIDYKAKGYKIALSGKGNVDGKECYKLKVTSKDGREETMFFNTTSYYHVRSVEKIKEDGKDLEAISNYGNYKKLPEGIVYPMSIENDGGPITIRSVEINKPVDERIFKPTVTPKSKGK